MSKTNRDLNLLTPSFKLKVELFLSEAKNIFVTEGFRSDARQLELFAQGRTTPWNIVTWTTSSKHQEWLAIDIAFKWDELYPSELSKWKEVWTIANKYWIDWGYDLWGKDKPHFQDNWQIYTPKQETMDILGKKITVKWFTYPSSIYGIPVKLKTTDSETLVWYASIKDYAPRSKKDEIFIFANTFKRWEEYLIKVLYHEAFHFFQHLVFSDEQNKYLEDLYKFIPDNVSKYAWTLHWEDWAETFGYWMTYIKNNTILPEWKTWNDAISFKYDACKKFVDSREEKLTELIKARQ